jgi:arsenite methyltransferase
MTDYLNYHFEDSPDFVFTFDEAPLWSASFGLLLLKKIPIRKNMTVVDLGCGTGFPLMEIAARIGKTGKLIGIDPWENAMNRAAMKKKNYGLDNMELIVSSADTIPLPDNSVNLVVSNLGINNFKNRDLVFLEAYRILKPEGTLAITTNLNGHWQEFYDIFGEVLNEMDETDLLKSLQEHQEHRGSVATTEALFLEAGFTIGKKLEEKMEMTFADGSAFLNHYFVKLGWLVSWLDLIPKEKQNRIFSLIEKNLNDLAEKNGHLCFTVPMLYIEGIKK